MSGPPIVVFASAAYPAPKSESRSRLRDRGPLALVGQLPDALNGIWAAGDKSRAPERFQPPKVFLATIVTHREFEMDWNRVEGNWKQMKGKVKEKWGNLTDDDLTAINGQRDQLEGKIQERYGLAKDKVRKDVDDWYNTQTW
jgi:uncharacterized protein YjbJ (UPF0337 family)